MVHHQAWKDSLLEYKDEIVSARSICFSQIIVSNQRNPKQLFHKLLINHSSLPASTHLCNTFLEFFNTKIDNICNHIINTHTSAASSLYISAFSGISLSNFAIHDFQSLCYMVLKMKATTSRVDPVPSFLFKSCFDSLYPVVLLMTQR